MFEEAPEIRCSTKNKIGFYVRACRQFLLGTKSRDGSEPKQPVDVIHITGLGSAITTCVSVAGNLQNRNTAKIVKVETAYPQVKASSEAEGKRDDRGVAQIKITLKVIPEARHFKNRDQLKDEEDEESLE